MSEVPLYTLRWSSEQQSQRLMSTFVKSTYEVDPRSQPLGPLGFNSPNIAQRHDLHVERTPEAGPPPAGGTYNLFPLGEYPLQGYLAQKKPRHPRTLQQTYACRPTAVLGWGAFSYERGTPVSGVLSPKWRAVYCTPTSA